MWIVLVWNRNGSMCAYGPYGEQEALELAAARGGRRFKLLVA